MRTIVRITPHGAAGGEVTGSAYVVETERARVLVDCGLFQGTPRAEERNRVPTSTSFGALDAVLLTHAHLDHTGRLPLLLKGGFAGPIYCTPATVDLTALILRDSAKVQLADLERMNRRRERVDKPPLEPLYTPPEVEAVLPLLRSVPYDEPIQVAPGIRACWTEAGHMLGSASILLMIESGGHGRRVVFSGDIGQRNVPILRDAEPFTKGDAVFLESTYGDHDHRPFKETVDEFMSILTTAVRERGKILVPTFAVGRAQLLMSLLSWMFRRRRIPPFPVILDSPMAIEATKIYSSHPELWDEELKQFVAEREILVDLQQAGGWMSVTADDSKKLNDLPGPCLIMAGAGMCNAGRILHHLRANLWKPETHVLIVGYQSRGTVGRSLVDGAKEVRIFGEPIVVKSRVHTLGGFSAHAGQGDLLRWFNSMAHCKPRVLLTHGENRAREPLARLIKQRYHIEAELPAHKEAIDL